MTVHRKVMPCDARQDEWRQAPERSPSKTGNNLPGDGHAFLGQFVYRRENSLCRMAAAVGHLQSHGTGQRHLSMRLALARTI